MSATDHTLTDAEHRDLRAAYERDKWAGEWNSLPTAIDHLFAARLATAEAEKEALRAERDEIAGRLSDVLCDLTGGKLSKAGYSAQTMIQAVEEEFERHTEVALVEERTNTHAAEAALAGLVAAVEAQADELERAAHILNVGGIQRNASRLRALLDVDHAAALRAREAKARVEELRHAAGLIRDCDGSELIRRLLDLDCNKTAKDVAEWAESLLLDRADAIEAGQS